MAKTIKNSKSVFKLCGFRTWNLFSVIILNTVLSWCFNVNFVSAILNGRKENSSKVRFYLYSDPLRYNLESGEELHMQNLHGLLNSNIRRDRSIKIIIHGYVHNFTCWFPQEIKDAYFEHGYHDNIVAVDWGPLATPKPVSALADYVTAVKNVPIVAKEIADFVSTLRDNNLMSNLNLVHLIGFSLGSHVAGLVGKDLQDRYGQKVGRITGLDPAGPLFLTGLVARRLRKSDAAYVDVIHTDQAEYGIIGPAGHADFYVNGGRPPQPGCRGNASCSHAAAANYFLQSIGNRDYVGCECPTYELFLSGLCKCVSAVPFGENSQPGTTGSFHLKMKPIPLSGRYIC